MNNEYCKHLLQVYADTFVIGQSFRCVHWNLRSNHFLAVHKWSSKAYKEISDTLDVLAERLRVFGVVVPTSGLEISQYQTRTDLICDSDLNMLSELKNSLAMFRESLNACIQMCAQCCDYGSQDILIKLIQFIDKQHWQLCSMLPTTPVPITQVIADADAHQAY